MAQLFFLCSTNLIPRHGSSPAPLVSLQPPYHTQSPFTKKLKFSPTPRSLFLHPRALRVQAFLCGTCEAVPPALAAHAHPRGKLPDRKALPPITVPFSFPFLAECTSRLMYIQFIPLRTVSQRFPKTSHLDLEFDMEAWGRS